MAINISTSKQKRFKEKTSVEFKGDGFVQGRISIDPEDKVSHFKASEALEMRNQGSLGKSYKVKVVGTDTRLIIKQKMFMGSTPHKVSLLYSEVYQFFLLSRDPSLVILVIPDHQSESRVYLLLKMKSKADAHAVCDVIEREHCKLLERVEVDAAAHVPSQSNGYKSDVHFMRDDDMEENRPSTDSPVLNMDTSRKGNTDKVATERKTGSFVEKNNPDESELHMSRQISLEQTSKDEVIISEKITTEGIPTIPLALIPRDCDLKNDPPKRVLPRTQLVDGSPNILAPDSRKKPHNNYKRKAPVTEEMRVDPPQNLKFGHSLDTRKESELRKALTHNSYDGDWAMDLKLIDTAGLFGSRLSETGNVYIFTAHHLAAEDYSKIDSTLINTKNAELK